MAENKSSVVPPQYDVNAKWDACLDLSLRRFVYSSLAGALGGLLLFRTPVTRWVSVAFGAGLGLGSAYTECSQLFGRSPAKLAVPQISKTPASQLLSVMLSGVFRSAWSNGWAGLRVYATEVKLKPFVFKA